MVLDSELVEQLWVVLRDADLTTTTSAIVRRKLEEHFGISLSDKKAFIRENIDLYLQTIQNEDGEERAGDGGEGHAECQEEEAVEEEEEKEEEEDKDDNESDESNTVTGNRKKGSIKPDKGDKKRGGGFTKLCSLSPQLQKFVGEAELARTQVVKQMWAYIRENNLQDPSNKRKIICDEKLQELFNVKSIDMFQMNKALAKHIWPLGSTNGPPKSTENETPKSKGKDKAKSMEKEKRSKKDSDSDEEDDEPPRKDKRQKTGSSGFLVPLRLSDALAKFTGETEMPRASVVKRIWEYIKENNLQDPSDMRRIICDDKLKELFEVETFTGFTVAKLLAPHFVKTEN